MANQVGNCRTRVLRQLQPVRRQRSEEDRERAGLLLDPDPRPRSQDPLLVPRMDQARDLRYQHQPALDTGQVLQPRTGMGQELQHVQHPRCRWDRPRSRIHRSKHTERYQERFEQEPSNPLLHE